MRFKIAVICMVVFGALGAPFFANAAIYLNDPGFTSNRTDIDKQWALVNAGFISAWEKTTGSPSTIIAVIDTGIDVTHVDLQSINFVPGYNAITGLALPQDTNSDDNGHGTLVAGVIGATPNNSTGVVGANWQVSIMPIKALDATGGGDSVSVSKGIRWATDHGAHIINLSLGGIGLNGDKLMADAIEYAFNRGVLIIAAAGNDTAINGLNLDAQPGYPVCDDNGTNMVIGVAAIDSKDTKPAFSNFGSHCVDVSAPGKRILSTINRDPVSGHLAPNSYAYASGTSLAVPYVSAEAALIRGLHPEATNRQIRDVILKAVDSIDANNPTQCSGGPCKGLLGTGKINVSKAVSEPIVTVGVTEGTLVLEEGAGNIYFINGGRKQPVSDFVRKQRFGSLSLIRVPASAVVNIPLGSSALPSEGILVKSKDDPTVYSIGKAGKLPISKIVFDALGLRFDQIITVSDSDLKSWLTGKFLSPREGTLVRGYVNPTVYWSVDGELHPINSGFYQSKGLNVFPILLVPDEDIASFQIGLAFVV